MKAISIVIPAYNEEKRLEPTLKQIIKYLKNNFDEYEIIVVDDGSSDRTCEVASNYNVNVLSNNINRGKGYSVKKGILEAKYPLVLFSDGDLATPIEELNKFIDYISDDYDIIIASRNLEKSNVKVKQPLYRQIMGKAFPRLVNLFIVRGFNDTQCGFKLFRTDTAKKIVSFQTVESFSFDVELLLIATRLGYKIKEAPVVWIDKEGTTVRTIKDGLRMLFDLFKIKYNDMLGKYSIQQTKKLQGSSE